MTYMLLRYRDGTVPLQTDGPPARGRMRTICLPCASAHVQPQRWPGLARANTNMAVRFNVFNCEV